VKEFDTKNQQGQNLERQGERSMEALHAEFQGV
jgi:hypothetical protein